MHIHTLPLVEGLAEFVMSESAKLCAPVNNLVTNKLLKGLEPETSGGLLCVVPAECAEAFLEELRTCDHIHKC